MRVAGLLSSFKGFGILSRDSITILIGLLGAAGFFCLIKSIQQLKHETEQNVGQTGVIFSILLLLLDAGLFYFYFILHPIGG